MAGPATPGPSTKDLPGRCAAQRRRARTRGAHPRQLDPRRGGHRAAHPARLHPHDAAVHRHAVAGARVRGDQRDGGVGAAAGPLIGGLITSALSWRAAFVFQALVIAVIVETGRSLRDPLPAQPDRPFGTAGAALSAVGLVLILTAILATDDSLRVMVALALAGSLVLVWFFASVPAKERRGEEALLSTSLFRNATSNLGMVTQNPQRLVLMGASFVVAGFGLSAVGVVILLTMVSRSPDVWVFVPGLLLIGLGVGVMLTPSVNIVQSSFGDDPQGEISGLSRSVSNLGSSLGSSLGTAIAGTILVVGITATAERAYGLAMAVLAVFCVLGGAAALALPRSGTATTPAARPAEAG